MGQHQEQDQEQRRQTSHELHDDLCGPYTEREYRVERLAANAATDQWLINCIRRLLRLPINRAPAEAAETVRRSYLRGKG